MSDGPSAPVTASLAASSDADVVAGIQNGQTESEAILYEKYSARVYYLALRASKSPHDAEDVRAETFLRVFQAVRSGQLRSASSLPAFMLGVMRNVLNELYAKRRQSGDVVPPEVAGLTAPSHEQLFLDREVQSAVRDTITALKPRERAVLRMHFFDELPTDEIAKRVGIAPERVRLVKSRALKHFRQVHERLTRALQRKKY